jgi:uncharacterized protein (DUF2235 family)
MKRIVVCMDGTWQSLNQDDLTNIGIISRSIAHKETRADGSQVEQIVFYTLGVGSSLSALSDQSLLSGLQTSLNRTIGGAFGEGLEDLILDTYLRIAFNYEAGDEIYIFGFSRGAFAARRLSGFINAAGIVSRRYIHMAREGFRIYYSRPPRSAADSKKQEYEERASEFRRVYGKGERNADGTRRQTDDVPPITYLGVFDTVAQRGWAQVLASFTPWPEPKSRRFQNYRVSPNVQWARHAVAIDENRLGFPITLWDGIEDDNARLGRKAYQQRWFVGTHGDIGGGNQSMLSALALKWIAEGARDAGLRFYGTYGEDRSPLDQRLREAGLSWDSNITRPKLPRALSPMNYAWNARKIWNGNGRPSLEDAEATFDESVFRRASASQLKYRPKPLRPYKHALEEWARKNGD